MTVQKSFFRTLTRLRFWVANYFLRVVYKSNAYKKCSLTSKLTFKINQNTTRQLQVATWQEKAIFVDFRNFTVGNTQGVELTVQKYFFRTLTRLRFWVANYFLRVVYKSNAYKKCSLTSKLTFKINQNTTRQLQVATWQEKAIFVDFQKSIRQKTSIIIGLLLTCVVL